MENKEINQRILKLWKQFANRKGTKKFPLLYPNFNIGCDVLFCGFNPSLTEKMKKEFDYKYPNNNFDKNTAIRIERKHKEPEHGYAPYFCRIWDICKPKNQSKKQLSWDHIDLFLIRGTNQPEIKKVIYDKNKKLTGFAKKQIVLFVDIIEKFNPKVIVIINALASTIIKKKLKNDDRIGGNFEKECFDRLRPNNTPLIFSGYIGSGRWDNHSLRILEWVIRKALKSTN